MDPDLVFRAQLRDRGARPILAAAAVIVAAVVAIALLPEDEKAELSGLAAVASTSPSSSPERSPSPRPADSPTPMSEPLEIDPGGYYIHAPYEFQWPPILVHLTLPAGWASAEAGTAVYKTEGGWKYPDTDGPSLAVHAVTGIVTDVCPSGTQVAFEKVGPTVEDMTEALVTLIGPDGPGPTDVMLAGYPAKRFVLTDILDSCRDGPDGRWLWENATGSRFAFLNGATAMIYVVDVDGDRLVLATHDRGPTPADVAELDAIIASVVIEPTPRRSPSISPSGVVDIEPVRVGRNSLTVDGIPLSFTLTTWGWDRFGGISINKSRTGPQGAEAMIYWTRVPVGAFANPCAKVLGPPLGRSAADLAAAVSTAPGTELVNGPSDVTVGGRAAKHMVVIVRRDVGCDPGYFYTWEDMERGPLWPNTMPGDTIRVWIVDVDDTRLFIAGETNPDAGPDLEKEVDQIIDSIRFD